ALPGGGYCREARAQLGVRGEDLLEHAIIEPVEGDIGVRRALIVVREHLASHQLAGAQRGHLLARPVRPAMSGDFAGIDQRQGATGVVGSQEMLAPSELDAADPTHAPLAARGFEPAERLRCFETTESLFLLMPFGCGPCGSSAVL